MPKPITNKSTVKNSVSNYFDIIETTDIEQPKLENTPLETIQRTSTPSTIQKGDILSNITDEFGEGKTYVNEGLDQTLYENQGSLEMIGQAIPKFIIGTSLKTVDQLGSVASGTLGLMTGDGYTKAAANSTVGNWAREAEESVDDYFKVFREPGYENQDWWKNVGQLGFWLTDGLDGAEFIASGVLMGFGVGAAIKGIGAGSSIARGLANMSRSEVLGGKTASKAASMFKNMDKHAITGMATLGEATLEAKDTYKQVTDNLFNAINPATGERYTSEEINQVASKSAAQTAALNLAVLWLPNKIQTEMFFGAGTSKSAIKNLFKGGELAEELAAPTVKDIILDVTKQVGKGVVSEGFWEENVQKAIQDYQIKRGTAHDGDMLDAIQAAITGMGTNLTDKEGQRAILTGALLGGLGGIKSGLIGENTLSSKHKQMIGIINQAKSLTNAFDAITDIYEKDTDGNIKVKNNTPVVDIDKAITIASTLFNSSFMTKNKLEAIHSGNQDLAEYIDHEALTQVGLGMLAIEGGAQAYKDFLAFNKQKTIEALPENGNKQQIQKEIEERYNSFERRADSIIAAYQSLEKYYESFDLQGTEKNKNLKGAKDIMLKAQIALTSDNIFYKEKLSEIEQELSKYEIEDLTPVDKRLKNKLIKQKKSYENLIEEGNQKSETLFNTEITLEELDKFLKDERILIEAYQNELVQKNKKKSKKQTVKKEEPKSESKSEIKTEESEEKQASTTDVTDLLMSTGGIDIEEGEKQGSDTKLEDLLTEAKEKVIEEAAAKSDTAAGIIQKVEEVIPDPTPKDIAKVNIEVDKKEKENADTTSSLINNFVNEIDETITYIDEESTVDEVKEIIESAQETKSEVKSTLTKNTTVNLARAKYKKKKLEDGTWIKIWNNENEQFETYPNFGYLQSDLITSPLVKVDDVVSFNLVKSGTEEWIEVIWEGVPIDVLKKGTVTSDIANFNSIKALLEEGKQVTAVITKKQVTNKDYANRYTEDGTPVFYNANTIFDTQYDVNSPELGQLSNNAIRIAVVTGVTLEGAVMNPKWNVEAIRVKDEAKEAQFLAEAKAGTLRQAYLNEAEVGQVYAIIVDPNGKPRRLKLSTRDISRAEAEEMAEYILDETKPFDEKRAYHLQDKVFFTTDEITALNKRALHFNKDYNRIYYWNEETNKVAFVTIDKKNKEIITALLQRRKHNVSLEKLIVEGKYTDKMSGTQYDSYWDYLTSESPIQDGINKSNAILRADVQNTNGSYFNDYNITLGNITVTDAEIKNNNVKNKIQPEVVNNKPNLKPLSTQSIKPGVSELFESNPKLANSVYEALVFKVGSVNFKVHTSKTLNAFLEPFFNSGDESIVEPFAKNLTNEDKKILAKSVGRNYKDINQFDWYEALWSDVGQEEVFYYLKTANFLEQDVQKEKRNSKLYKEWQSFVKENKEFADAFHKLPEKVQKEQQKDFNKLKEKDEWYLFELDNLEYDIRKKLLKDEGYIENNINLNNQITPEQKKQAQKLYSQYLNTIFPDSKVRDIVYHGSKHKFEKFDKSKLGSNTNPNKEFPQFNDSYLGFHFTSNPEYYRNRFEFGSKYEKSLNEYIAILNIQNPKDIADKDEFSQNNIQFIKPEDVKNNDSIIYDYLDTVDFSSEKKVNKYTNNYVVFEPEQIHILGTKQDIENFKKFVNKDITVSEISDEFTIQSFEDRYSNIDAPLSDELNPDVQKMSKIPKELLEKLEKNGYKIKQDENCL